MANWLVLKRGRERDRKTAIQLLTKSRNWNENGEDRIKKEKQRVVLLRYSFFRMTEPKVSLPSSLKLQRNVLQMKLITCQRKISI
jgi:hypothetical protein